MATYLLQDDVGVHNKPMSSFMRPLRMLGESHSWKCGLVSRVIGAFCASLVATGNIVPQVPLSQD